ncbi:MAG: trimethylamine methyltransferase family protein [bacterium]|nr:trimethylamine methyltransferase family protein [bacterium]
MRQAASAFGALAAAQVERIDALSLQVLERVGVRVDRASIRAILATRGARVEEATQRVHLSEDVLRELLAGAPADVGFGCRGGAATDRRRRPQRRVSAVAGERTVSAGG